MGQSVKHHHFKQIQDMGTKIWGPTVKLTLPPIIMVQLNEKNGCVYLQ